MWRYNLKISRPRFWPYLLGPFVIGAVAASTVTDIKIDAWLVLMALFYTYPANFIIYGTNDVYDYDTDKLNPKKRNYEALVGPKQRDAVLRQVTLWLAVGYLLLEFVPGYHDVSHWGLLGFYFFGLMYSMPPIRAKARPLLDSLFNVLYIFPAMVSYGLLTLQFPNWRLFAAAGIWCMAMHAYSAVPDIAADGKAKIKTIATWLGARGTLLFCIACYITAAALSWPELQWFSVVAGSLYIGIVLLSLVNPDREQVFKLYKYFPYINFAVGGALFSYIALAIG